MAKTTSKRWTKSEKLKRYYYVFDFSCVKGAAPAAAPWVLHVIIVTTLLSPISLLLATMMSLVLLEYLTRVSVRGSDADPDAKRGHRCARGRPSTHQQRHRRPSNRTIHDASQRHVDGGFPFRVQLKFRCAMMWWCFVLSWRCRRRRCLRLLCRRVLSHDDDDDDDDGVSSSLSSSSSSSSSSSFLSLLLCVLSVLNPSRYTNSTTLLLLLLFI